MKIHGGLRDIPMATVRKQNQRTGWKLAIDPKQSYRGVTETNQHSNPKQTQQIQVQPAQPKEHSVV